MVFGSARQAREFHFCRPLAPFLDFSLALPPTPIPCALRQPTRLCSRRDRTKQVARHPSRCGHVLARSSPPQRSRDSIVVPGVPHLVFSSPPSTTNHLTHPLRCLDPASFVAAHRAVAVHLLLEKFLEKTS
ncbi:uncharacterized protein BDZ99DRAFT_575040 [Mytilinidion resinicola]|uniref:Uncharacterized protein n=1 Tax=Mytilinidion resinicola TaxID=574789 RepID=A0A6A6Y7P8_9PEZI|nr:uncharacterized protein BDZ99DRAFT_575040 [Mytilinidion resinicola]KAF2804832.1 hypothetical protein BDZ99DRAFT_575040 [Mytilinidion resinicola]